MTYLGASQVALVVKNPPVNAGDIRELGSIPGLGGCPGGGHGNPLQYSCLEKPMDRGAWRAPVHRGANSQTWLKWLSTVHTWLTYFIKMKKLIASQINGKFHLNQPEDDNQGNSLLEELWGQFWRGEERGSQYVCDFRIGWVQSSTHLAGRLLLFIREQTSELMVLVLFQVWEDAGNWVHKIFTQKRLMVPGISFVSFPRGQNSSLWSSSWIPFRV